MAHLTRLVQLILIVLLCTSCLDNLSGTRSDKKAAPTPDPAFATPALTLSEDPLTSEIPAVPSVLIVPVQQSKATLADLLKTTPEQLDWVNPGLPEPVPAGQLVVIPPVYRASGETLSEVSEKTGVPVDRLLSYNPNFDANKQVIEGEMLIVPPIFIVPEETLITEAAEILGIDKEALLSANPDLASDEVIKTGVILVVPRGNDGE